MTIAVRLDNTAAFTGFAAVDIDMAGVGRDVVLGIDTGLLVDHVTVGLAGANSAAPLAFADTGAADSHGAMLVGADGVSTSAVNDLPVIGMGEAADCGAIATGIDLNLVPFLPRVEPSRDLTIVALLHRIEVFAAGGSVSLRTGAGC